MAQVSGDPGMGFALADLFGALGNMGDDTMFIDMDLIERTFWSFTRLGQRAH